MEVCGLTRSFFCTFAERAGLAFKGTPAKLRFFKYGCRCTMLKPCGRSISAFHTCALGTQLRLGISMNRQQQCHTKDSSQSALGSVVPVFSVVKYESTGNISFFERKKTELYQELGLQARDLRFQHLTSINTRNNCIILRMEILKAVITPKYLLILDYHQSNLEHWLLKDLTLQLAGDGQLATYSLPFEFRAIEAILHHRPSQCDDAFEPPADDGNVFHFPLWNPWRCLWHELGILLRRGPQVLLVGNWNNVSRERTNVATLAIVSWPALGTPSTPIDALYLEKITAAGWKSRPKTWFKMIKIQTH